MAWSKLVDMQMTPDEREETMCVPLCDALGPQYPYGLRICLTDKELDKLGLDFDCGIGDMVDMRCFGIVTSISQNDGPDGPCGRVEIQVQRMAVENEMTESEED